MCQNLKRVLFGTLVACCMQAGSLRALPAYPAPMQLRQPDGTTITVRLCGDEFFHYYITDDGYPLAQDAQGYFCYALWNSGGLKPTSVRANDVERRRMAEISLLRTVDADQVRKQLAGRYREVRMESPLRRAVGSSNYPTMGEQQTIAILVEFPKVGDGEAVTFTTPEPRQTFDDMLNKQGFDYDGGTGSVSDYYYESSNKQFRLHFDVFGPVMLDNDISFYGNDELNTWNMVVEACQKLDGQVDFSQYDRNKDGVIDNVYVFYAGQGEADGGPAYTIWPHASDVETLTGNRYVFDGVRLNHYACSNEIRVMNVPGENRNDTIFTGIGTVCHEFTHVMGFPDLYNTQDQSASFTPGTWSLMDMGAYNNNSRTPPYFTAYERYSMGWLEPETITEPSDIILDNISKNKAYRIDTPKENEFFLFENRQQQGWDKFLPGHGMLVWHITYSEEAWEKNAVNNVDLYQGIDIEEADGLWTEPTRAGDAFPGTDGVTEFTDETFPSMRTSDGELPVGMPITHIEERNGLIHFKVKGGKPAIEPVRALPATEVTPISFVANWEANPKAVGYKLDVYSVAGSSNVYVEGFQGKVLNETNCLVQGLRPETTYYYKVRAMDAMGESVASEPVEVTTGEATFEYTAPIAAEATEVTDTSFVANWESMEGAVSYRIDLYQKAKGVADTLSVDFTGGIKALPAGWRTDSQMTLQMAGAYGKAAPSLSLSADYGYIESPVLAENVRGVGFWYRERNNPSGDNYVVVSGHVGNEWLPIDTLWLDEPQQAGENVFWSDADAVNKIPERCDAVRISYRLMGRGALAVDDVVVAYDDKLYVVPMEGWRQKAAGSGTSFEVDGLQPGTTYYYTIRGDDGRVVTIPSQEVAVKTTGYRVSIAPSAETTDAVRFCLDGGMLRVECADEASRRVELFDLQGRVVAAALLERGCAILRLPGAGVYIARIGGMAYKVAM